MVNINMRLLAVMVFLYTLLPVHAENFYTGDELCDFPTCSHYCVGFEVDDWRATSRSMGVLLNFTVPQQLKP